MINESILKSYLRNAESFIQFYSEVENKKSFAVFIKEQFKKQKKFGKRDRKFIIDLCFAFFRCAHSISTESIQEKMAAGILLQKVETGLPKDLLNNLFHFDETKLEQVKLECFPFSVAFSEGINKEEWVDALFNEQYFFVRIRKDFVGHVKDEFNSKGINFSVIPGMNQTLRLNQSEKVTETESFQNAYFEIQDLSSQKTGAFFSPQKGESWWDTCAASGGKSLMLLEKESNIKLFASDVRKSILDNYSTRLAKAGHKAVVTQVMDLTVPYVLYEEFDGIICDVPCSGSGTWSSHPEQLYQFHTRKLEAFYPIQSSILSSAFNRLKQNGKLYYITCSVFESENEAVVKSIVNKGGIVLNQELINGSSNHSDHLFIAEIVKG